MHIKTNAAPGVGRFGPLGPHTSHLGYHQRVCQSVRHHHNPVHRGLSDPDCKWDEEGLKQPILKELVISG